MLRLWTAALLAAARCAAMQVEVDPVALEGGQVDVQRASKQVVGAVKAECKRLNREQSFRPWTHEMDKLSDSRMWAKVPPKREVPNAEEVKMAFLVFADDRMENEEIWLHWVDQGRKAGLKFSMYIHAIGVANNQSTWQSERFKEHVLPNKIKTRWCKLWDAQMSMISRALVDPGVTHLVILSSDSVPVKPMAWMYNEAHSDPASRFCADDRWRDPWPRAETWSVLRRDDAMFFHDNKDFAEKNFRRGCEDQLAWYFPMRVRFDNFHQHAPLKQECIMFANWKDGDDTCEGQWAKNVDRCDCKALRASSSSTPADYETPVSYTDVDEDALEELVRSPFWFARRFTEGAVPQRLTAVLDINLSQPKPKKKFKLFR